MIKDEGVNHTRRSRQNILNRIDLASNPVFKWLYQLWKFLKSINFSIRAKILFTLGVVILIMGSTNVLLVVQVLEYNHQYDSIIINITTANRINGTVKPVIDAEMYKVVSGKIEFKDGIQYETINNINSELDWMMNNTNSPRAQIKLLGIQRAMKSLTEYVDQMGVQIKEKRKAADNETLMDNIRFATSVVEEVVQDYALFEVSRTGEQYQVMRQGFINWEIVTITLMACTIVFSVVAALNLSNSIYKPIKKLHDVTQTITKNDLQVLVTSENIDEITELGITFNLMIGKIKELLDSKIKEQQNLKKAELRALQAQINPHFLYNTLDTIIWMAEAKKISQVKEIVQALSSFFRISLSKGLDWITIGEEVERAKNYLIIQKMRYHDILDFKIEMDENVENYTVLKLILQPLVENALYHGIKNKRNGGMIVVRARQKSENEIILEVEDNGIGFTPQKLAQLQTELNDESDEIRLESGFGVGNVNKRIRLYYGKPYGLTIKSEYETGTCATLVIPAKKGDKDEEITLPDDILNKPLI
jgi:two-component system, sensor histidine kinase YesM